MKLRVLLACAVFALAGSAKAADNCQLKLIASLDTISSADGIMVPVTLQGQAGGYMLLGFDNIISGVSEAVASKLDLRRDSIPQNVWVNINRQKIFQRAEVNIQLGGSRGDAHVAIIPSFVKSDPRVVGLLALDVLNQFDVELDLAHDKLNLFSPDHCKGQVIYWTRSAPVAALPMTVRNLREFVVPMQLDGKDINAEISTNTEAALDGRVAHDVFGLDNAKGSHQFKMLAVDGLGIANPTLMVYEDKFDPCNGNSRQEATPLHTERNPRMEQCYGNADLRIGLPQLKHLRVFVAFQERMVYATAADAN
jgi:hypothetical protein